MKLAVSKKTPLSILRRRSDFTRLFEKGYRIHPSQWLTINWLTNDVGHFRCGWTIPGKVGPSVVRNRLKRWLRQFLREKVNQGACPKVDVNFLIRARDAGFYRKLSYDEFTRVVEKAWGRLP